METARCGCKLSFLSSEGVCIDEARRLFCYRPPTLKPFIMLVTDGFCAASFVNGLFSLADKLTYYVDDPCARLYAVRLDSPLATPCLSPDFVEGHTGRRLYTSYVLTFRLYAARIHERDGKNA